MASAFHERPVLPQRYANLAVAIHLLRRKRLTLVDPVSWDDKNDVYFMEEYKRFKRAETVLALCFAQKQGTAEAYHHWRVFANGSDGVCIQFAKPSLLSSFYNKELVHGPVSYMSSRQLHAKANAPKLSEEQLPFIKGSRYRHEQEYRVIFVDTQERREPFSYSLPVDIGSIHKVTLSPWLSSSLAREVRHTLRSFDRCEKLNVVHSTLRNNAKWRSIRRQIGSGS